VASVVAVALVAAAGGLLIALDRGWGDSIWSGKGDDYAYALVALSPCVLGFVTRHWWSVLATAAIFAVTILIQQLTWVDDPTLTGTDDLEPWWGIVAMPLPITVAAMGVGLGYLVRQAREP
jgi:hypothetical protein